MQVGLGAFNYNGSNSNQKPENSAAQKHDPYELSEEDQFADEDDRFGTVTSVDENLRKFNMKHVSLVPLKNTASEVEDPNDI